MGRPTAKAGQMQNMKTKGYNHRLQARGNRSLCRRKTTRPPFGALDGKERGRGARKPRRGRATKRTAGRRRSQDPRGDPDLERLLTPL
eukprot:6127917-Pyramimonas_sp.AAC.1